MATSRKYSATDPLIADYDRAVDVLHVVRGLPVELEGDGLPGGVELDYAVADGSPCGVTIVGYYRNQWSRKPAQLAKIIAKHLSVGQTSVSNLILDEQAVYGSFPCPQSSYECNYHSNCHFCGKSAKSQHKMGRKRRC